MELEQMSSQAGLVEGGSNPPSYEESQRRASQSRTPKRQVTIDSRVAPENAASADGEGERGSWGNQFEFLLTCVSYAVGLGNVWRFPYLAYKNGGGAFIIPYVIMLLIAGLPIFFMELAFGQFASLGPLSIWKCCPLMKGLGFGMVTVSWFICLYFAVLIAYILFFLFASMTSELPWKTCDNTWNTDRCFAPNRTANVTANVSLYEATDDLESPSTQYFYRNVLQQSDGIDNIGLPEWRLTLLLLLCWILVCLGLLKGVQSLGKVSYFTAIFPYILITLLVVNGSLLDGAVDGITFYMKPEFHKLKKPQVWADAAIQIFYSLGPCMGTLITMSSYNKFKNNCMKNALTVALINCCTSVYGGFAIFSVIGFMAKKANVTVDKVAKTGPGLAFVVYPEGLAQIKYAPIWSVLFFFMMFTIGMGSMLSQLETVISALLDEFPVFRTSKKVGRFRLNMSMLFRIGICTCGFLLGLPQVTRGGFYILNIMDNFVGGINLLLLGFFEIITIMYIYGYDYFAQDIELMLGRKPNIYWKTCWKYLTLTVLGFVIFFWILYYAPPKCDDYVYPNWAISMGWCISISSLVWLPLMAIKTYCDRSGMWQEFKGMSHPDGDWGPAHEEDRLGRYAGPGFDREIGIEDEEEEMIVNISRRAPIPVVKRISNNENVRSIVSRSSSSSCPSSN